MNLHNHEPNPTQPGEHPTDPVIDALLNDALGADIDATDLEQRILTLTDPSLNAMLDRALAADPLPEGLSDRVLAATLDARQPAPARSVLARIGFQTARYAAAAAVVFAAGLGIYVATQNQTGPDASTDIAQTDPDDPAAPALTYDQFVDRFEPTADLPIDERIQQLDSRISSVDDNIWGGDTEDFEQALWNELSGEG